MASLIQRNASDRSRRLSTYQAIRNSFFLRGEDITHAEQPEISPMSSTFLDTHDQDPRTKTASFVTVQERNSSGDYETESPRFSIKRKPISPTSPDQNNRVQMFEERKDTQYLLLQEPTQSTIWRIHWLRPVIIVLMPFLALVLALGHHFYYLSLHHTKSGDAGKQAWPIRFGTAFAFLVTSCLHAGTAAAAGQYVWTVVKRKPLSISSLDKLFDLTSNPISLFSWELLMSAKIAIFFGLLFWLLGWSGVAPPATLTVIAQNVKYTISIPTLDFNQSGWNTSSSTWQPGAVVNRIAAQAASSFGVVPLPRQVSSIDWNYTVQFFGPSVQCNIPNTTEQLYLDALVQKFENDSATFAWAKVNDTTYNTTASPNWLLHSAWAPGLPAGAPYNWAPAGIDFGDGLWLDASISPSPQTWIQTSTSGMVCTSLNASFDITVASVNGTQQIIQQAVDIIGPYPLGINIEYTYYTETFENMTSLEGYVFRHDWHPYVSHHYALAALLSGNLTIPDRTGGIGDESSDPPRHYLLQDVNTRTNVLTTGLMACNDIARSPFRNLRGDVVLPNDQVGTFDRTFPTETWMCRNKTLARAIEDLANNITISYLSSPDLTNSNTTFRNITTSDTVNVYEYHPFFLVLSYGIGLFFAAIAALIGLFSVYANGVSHSSSFSAIIATTRNSDLDSLTQGLSLGAEPLQTHIMEAKLRFGSLLGREASYTTEQDSIPRLGFGLEEKVGRLRKGQAYR